MVRAVTHKPADVKTLMYTLCLGFPIFKAQGVLQCLTCHISPIFARILIYQPPIMKITVVGAGAVGATCADNIARKELCEELVLVDIKEGIAEGKAQDMMQTAALLGFDTKIVGSTNDYSKTAGSDVVVITSGLPRKPGMTREELIGVNAGIVKSVTENILKYSPNTIIIVVSNPMDTMNYLTLKTSGLPKKRLIGIGGHGDTTMIPLTRLATYNGIPVSRFLSADKLEKVAADTMVGGATLTKL